MKKKCLTTLLLLAMNSVAYSSGTCQFIYQSKNNDLRAELQKKNENLGISWVVAIGAGIFGGVVWATSNQVGEQQQTGMRITGTIPAIAAGGNLLYNSIQNTSAENDLIRYESVVNLYGEAKKDKNNLAKKVVGLLYHTDADKIPDDEPLIKQIKDYVINGYENGSFCSGGFPLPVDLLMRNIKYNISYGIMNPSENLNSKEISDGFIDWSYFKLQGQMGSRALKANAQSE